MTVSRTAIIQALSAHRWRLCTDQTGPRLRVDAPEGEFAEIVRRHGPRFLALIFAGAEDLKLVVERSPLAARPLDEPQSAGGPNAISLMACLSLGIGQRLVLRHLLKGRPLSARTLSERTGLKERTVRARICELRRFGFLIRYLSKPSEHRGYWLVL